MACKVTEREEQILATFSCQTTHVLNCCTPLPDLPHLPSPSDGAAKLSYHISTWQEQDNMSD